MAEPLIDIRPDHWKIVSDILRKRVPEYEVWAFGSRAKWSAKEYSDLDLAFISNKPLSIEVGALLSEDFSASDLPFRVDVVDWATTSESFRKIIARDKVVVQNASNHSSQGKGSKWKKIRLGEVCSKIGSGATPRGGSDVYLDNGKYALIRSQNIYNEGFHRDGLAFIGENHADELSNVEVKKGDILLNITGDSVARCCQVEPSILPARVNQHVAIIRPDPKLLNSRLLRYILVSAEMQSKLLSWAGAGATRNALTKSMIESLDVFVPENIDEQEGIAYILGTIDDKIESNKRINETLEVMARAMFKSWFVEFDPVVAKMEGQDSGLLKEIADLFPDSFKESELGLIPEGWVVKPLSEITDVITKGTTPTQEDMSNAPDTAPRINFVRVNSIDKDGSIIFDKLTKIPLTVHTGVLKRSILQANDILYTIAGTIGRIATAEDQILPANANQAVAIIRPKPTIPTSFLVLTMQNEAFREELHNNIVHAVQANLSLGMLSKARAVVPPVEVLLKIFKPIDCLMSKINDNRTQSRTLATIRETLLPRLLNGELGINQELVNQT